VNVPSWATTALDDDPARALGAIHGDLTVQRIATSRAAFETCAAHETLASVIERNRAKAFDFLPVTESAVGAEAPERLIGLIEILPYMHANYPRGLVRDAMLALSEDNLIGADASIIAFVRTADRQRCRLVISGSQISGLVSLSDLQRLPVRVVLFAMITQLETIMTGCIRNEFAGSEDWIERISPERQSKLRERAAAAKRDDGFVEFLLLTEFADKVTIIRRSPEFRWARESFRHDLRRVQMLRNDLAHANDYASTRAAAIKTCETVRLTELWIDRLGAWRSGGTQSRLRGRSWRSPITSV
jgi:hypothetical protein